MTPKIICEVSPTNYSLTRDVFAFLHFSSKDVDSSDAAEKFKSFSTNMAHMPVIIMHVRWIISDSILTWIGTKYDFTEPPHCYEWRGSSWHFCKYDNLTLVKRHALGTAI